MTRKKGQPGYLAGQKKLQVIKTIVYYAAILAVFLAGLLTTHTRLNLLTIAAVVGALPAGKQTVLLVMYLREKVLLMGTERELADKLRNSLPDTDRDYFLYELIPSTKERTYPLECVFVYRQGIAACCLKPGTDLPSAQKAIRRKLEEQSVPNPSVQIFPTVAAFAGKVKELADGEAMTDKERRRRDSIRNCILSVSL